MQSSRGKQPASSQRRTVTMKCIHTNSLQIPSFGSILPANSELQYGNPNYCQDTGPAINKRYKGLFIFRKGHTFINTVHLTQSKD